MWPEIARRPLAPHARVFSMASLGLNHDGDLTQAIALVDAAAGAGVVAVQIPALCADSLVAAGTPPPAHAVASSLRDYLSGFELDLDAYRAVVARAREHELAVVCTPLSEEAIDRVGQLEIDAYRIASGDVTNEPLITAAARTGRAVIISTGMSSLDEVVRAVTVARRVGAEQIAVLHCVSAYPAQVQAENLRAIQTLQCALDVPVGLADHGTGPVLSAVAAVALGACLYERHLATGHGAIAPAICSTPAELREIVGAMDRMRLALGDGRKRCLPAEAMHRAARRRGLYARRTMRAGERILAADVIALRPATALAPADLPRLLDSTLSRDVLAGAPFRPEHLVAVERAS